MAHVWGNILILVFAHFVGSQGNQCGEPTKYPDRRLDEKYHHISDFNHDDNVEYNCAPGYRRTGGSRISFCKEGRWTPSDLTCEMVKCPDIKIINSKQFSKIVRYNTTVDITCEQGFILRGAQHLRCELNGSWTPDVPTCEPVRCSAPLMVNGKIQSGVKQHYKPLENLTVSCTEGYDLIGLSLVTCGSDGQWQRLPECRPEVRCSAPLMVNGKIQSGVKLHYKPLENVTVSCTEGYDLIGSSLVTCGPQGQWERLPECRFKVSLTGNCGPAPRYPHAHLRDEYSPTQREHTAEARLRYKCTIGHRLAGAVYCPPPPLVRNADMFDRTYEQVPFGYMVSYRCRTGSLIGAKRIHCTKNGTWSAPPPECRGKQ
ncbi:P-selectin CD62 antigen-like family member P [Triplophysa tibetana]|uniref:P-selectin CD62 antigen-like family member P n=1 Tax=Triplophysa tibetana TaxID=1572043 RepID=A0A5A9NBV4_9TELE|nr:P-selectin CD62 antigen-like family member P [Triplophysa tibetana]